MHLCDPQTLSTLHWSELLGTSTQESAGWKSKTVKCNVKNCDILDDMLQETSFGLPVASVISNTPTTVGRLVTANFLQTDLGTALSYFGVKSSNISSGVLLQAQ